MLWVLYTYGNTEGGERMHHSERAAVVKVVLYKDEDCRPGVPPGLFFQAKPNEDSYM